MRFAYLVSVFFMFFHACKTDHKEDSSQMYGNRGRTSGYESYSYAQTTTADKLEKIVVLNQEQGGSLNLGYSEIAIAAGIGAALYAGRIVYRMLTKERPSIARMGEEIRPSESISSAPAELIPELSSDMKKASIGAREVPISQGDSKFFSSNLPQIEGHGSLAIGSENAVQDLEKSLVNNPQVNVSHADLGNGHAAVLVKRIPPPAPEAANNSAFLQQIVKRSDASHYGIFSSKDLQLGSLQISGARKILAWRLQIAGPEIELTKIAGKPNQWQASYMRNGKKITNTFEITPANDANRISGQSPIYYRYTNDMVQLVN